MNTLTLRRDHVGRFAQKNLLTRFLFWLAALPFVILGWTIMLLYRTLRAVLPSRRVAGKIIWYQFVVLGWVLALLFARQVYVVRCSEGGWFMTKEHCGELAQQRFDSQELSRVQFLETNKDILQ